MFVLRTKLRFQRAARMREAGKQHNSPAKLVATFGQPHEDGLDGSLVAHRSSLHPIFQISHSTPSQEETATAKSLKLRTTLVQLKI